MWLLPDHSFAQNSAVNAHRPNLLSLVVAAGLALSAAVALMPQARAQSDADFLAAKAAFDKGDRKTLDGLAAKLRGHVLAPYVEYWQFRLDLDAADAKELRTAENIDENPGTGLQPNGTWGEFDAPYTGN